METEQTLVLIKPDGVQRGLIGEIITRYEHKGLKIVAMKMLQLPRVAAEALYAPHRGKSFYDLLINFMTSAPIVALAIEGQNAVELVRILNGDTNPKKSEPGSIRGDFSIDISHNVVHASDTPKTAERELEILFAADERCQYRRLDEAILNAVVSNVT